MKQYMTMLIGEMEGGLRELDPRLPAKEYVAQAVKLLTRLVEEVKQNILQYDFLTLEEEIDTFKNLVPEIFAYFIYYRKLYNLHSHALVTNTAVQKKQLRRELKKITFFFISNKELLTYYADGLTDRDRFLFTRKFRVSGFCNEDYFFLVDDRFCPLTTYKLAKMKAYRLLETDILQLLNGMKQSLPINQPPVSRSAVQWTASKSAATELVYGLFASGVFNSGQAKLKEIVAAFEKGFSLSLEGYQRSYQDLKMRKKSRTSFLSDLRTRLENKMDEEE